MKTIRNSDPFCGVYLELGQRIKTEWHGERIFIVVATSKGKGCKKCAFSDDSVKANKKVCQKVQCFKLQRQKNGQGFPLDKNFQETSVFFRKIEKDV